MKKLIVILKDQLSFNLSSLRNADPVNDTLFFCELVESSTAHHQKKIAFGLACMRHFARALEKQAIPKRLKHKKSAILKEILVLVEKNFSHHFGNLHPFHYAVTREEALLELDDFIKQDLPFFGD